MNSKLVLILTLFIANLAMAQSINLNKQTLLNTQSFSVSDNLSVVLQSKEFSQSMAQLMLQANQSNTQVKISSITEQTDLRNRQSFVTVHLSQSLKGRKNWQPVGSLVFVLMNTHNEDKKITVYFKPNDELPGGASVGNR